MIIRSKLLFITIILAVLFSILVFNYYQVLSPAIEMSYPSNRENKPGGNLGGGAN